MKPKVFWKSLSACLALAAAGLVVLNPSLNQVTRFLLIVTLVALALSSLVELFVSRSLTRFINEISELVQGIAQGRFSKRLSVRQPSEFGDLARSIHTMASDLERQFAEIESERNRLATILDGMIEGVLVTDQEGKIVLFNPALQAMLSVDRWSVGKTILECVRNRIIHDSIAGVLKAGKADEQEVNLLQGSEERSLIIHTAPLVREAKTVGTVSVFYDATRLRRLENIRREFVANVSHELKTPLTVIRGCAETLQSGGLQDSEIAGNFLGKIEANALQLQHLVEDILKLSEMESGRMEIKPVMHRLADVIRDLQVSWEEALRAKQMTFAVHIPPACVVYAESLALQQILGNLMDNAVKYTPPEGSIEISAATSGSLCKISVRDTGIGISPQDLPHVFERFYRVDRARSRAMGGTGLGLAIVKHLVEVHGGEVGVNSRPGHGSEFFFTIPVAVEGDSA